MIRRLWVFGPARGQIKKKWHDFLRCYYFCRRHIPIFFFFFFFFHYSESAVARLWQKNQLRVQPRPNILLQKTKKVLSWGSDFPYFFHRRHVGSCTKPCQTKLGSVPKTKKKRSNLLHPHHLCPPSPPPLEKEQKNREEEEGTRKKSLQSVYGKVGRGGVFSTFPFPLSLSDILTDVGRRGRKASSSSSSSLALPPPFSALCTQGGREKERSCFFFVCDQVPGSRDYRFVFSIVFF